MIRQDWIIIACALGAVAVAWLPIWTLEMVFVAIAAMWMAWSGVCRILDGFLDHDEKGCHDN